MEMSEAPVGSYYYCFAKETGCKTVFLNIRVHNHRLVLLSHLIRKTYSQNEGVISPDTHNGSIVITEYTTLN